MSRSLRAGLAGLFTVALILLAAGLSGADPEPKAPAPERGWLGVYMEARQAEGHGAVLLPVVVPGSPAERGGLRSGDLVLGLSEPFTAGQDTVLTAFRDHIATLHAGEALPLILRRTVTELRRGDGVFEDSPELPKLEALLADKALVKLEARRVTRTLRLTVTLGPRPGRRITKLPDNATLAAPLFAETAAIASRLGLAPLRPGIERLTEIGSLKGARADVLRRLAEDELNDDDFRLPAFRRLHRDPEALPDFGRALTAELSRLSPGAALGLAGRLLEPDRAAARMVWGVASGASPITSATPVFKARPPAPLPLAGDWAAWREALVARLAEAARAREFALADLTRAERAQLLAGLPGLVARFKTSIYLHTDDDRARLQANLALIPLLAKVRREAFAWGLEALAPLADSGALAALRDVLRAEFRGRLDRDLVHREDTALGPLVILGEAANQGRPRGAIVIDLGGDDLVLGGGATARGDARPVALHIDLGGDDRYQSDELGSQGCGLLGIGVLIDGAGDDLYLAGGSLAQGAGYAGAGAVFDLAGDDDWQGTALCQGAALAAGVGLLVDLGGDDHHRAELYSQGFGGPGGLGLVLARGGDDRWFGGGASPSSYGTAHVFRGFCQGVSCGFRGFASGGVGLLVDRDGDDRYVAGNFSQGGGYYFGLGMLADLGAGRDRYVGARYGQAFSAHSAGGFFYEDGGDDSYAGIIGALNGAAWDLSFATFIDAAGDDRITTLGGFSLGASAHNGHAIFLDLGGRDRYDNGQGPARSGPNDYHGGASLSLFVKAGATDDGGRPRGAGFADWRRGRRAGRSGEGGLWLRGRESFAELSRLSRAELEARIRGGS